MTILDGHNLLWRGHHAATDLETADGRPSGALYAGLMMLSRLPELLERDRLIVAWDGDVSWRKEILPEYKANRRTTEEAQQAAVHVQTQIGRFRETLRAIGVAQVRHSTLEADDWAGILTAKVPLDEPITLLSSDKDWFQLLDGRTRQIRKWKEGELDEWTAETVIEKYGVDPEHWAEFQALTGDVVDNIPKVRRGVGPVRARNMLHACDPPYSWAGLPLSSEELKVFERNLEITRLLDKLPHGSSMRSCLEVPDLSRKNRRRRVFDSIIDDYELRAVRSVRHELWCLGSWR